MYKRVLATVNEHLNSEVAARYALHFAKRADAMIYFCSVAARSIAEKNFQTAEDAINRLMARATDLAVQADGILSTGEPLEQINKIVTSEKIDLVFAATRHEDVEKRFYARTVARRLSLRLPCSVALVRVVHLGRVHPRNILVPLKARIDHVDERAEFTALMAGAFDARIHILHTSRPVTRLFTEDTLITPVDWNGANLSSDMTRFIRQLSRPDLSLEKKLIPGTAGRSITIEAATRRHDMIIMGASERSLLSSFFRGNPVERVLREATCDLIILKPRMSPRGQT
jgi:nucleotide-binding universal stress UspA family protein